eukprot:scaffold255348_cov15-Tisochrysis_lutea.AAC.2
MAMRCLPCGDKRHQVLFCQHMCGRANSVCQNRGAGVKQASPRLCGCKMLSCLVIAVCAAATGAAPPRSSVCPAACPAPLEIVRSQTKSANWQPPRWPYFSSRWTGGHEVSRLLKKHECSPPTHSMTVTV